VVNVKVRAKKLNVNSEVNIIVSEKDIVQWQYNMISLWFVFAFVGIFIFAFVCTFLYSFFFKNCGRWNEIKIIKFENQGKRVVRVKEFMNYMENGKYPRQELHYSEKVCAIWLELYKRDQNLHIINGCKHSFHTCCLKNSFEKVKLKRSLKCPSWNMKLEHNEIEVSLQTAGDTDMQIN